MKIFWSIKQLEKFYGVSRQTIYTWIWSGKIPAARSHPYGGRYWEANDLPSKKGESK